VLFCVVIVNVFNVLAVIPLLGLRLVSDWQLRASNLLLAQWPMRRAWHKCVDVTMI
jgi:hypothetical protein